jgi:hypothetical protein
VTPACARVGPVGPVAPVPASQRGRRHAIAATAVACAVVSCFARDAQSAGATHGFIDRTAARFFAPETGGTEYPRFVFERILSFEARLVVMAEAPEGIGDGYDERDVREALEHHVAEEILSSLADKLIADSPPDKRPSPETLAAIERTVASAIVERTGGTGGGTGGLGGRARIDAAAAAEHVDRTEVEAMLRRGAFAAWYVDRALTPLLHPSEEQIREVYRSSPHPYRGQPFDQVRAPLERWFVIERVRVAESTFLQAARSRVRIIVTP